MGFNSGFKGLITSNSPPPSPITAMMTRWHQYTSLSPYFSVTVRTPTLPCGYTACFPFCCPYVSIHSCKENQLDALFTLSIFRQSVSTCFGRIYSPSSGGTPYIYNNWHFLFFLVDCLLSWLGTQPGQQSTKKHNTYQLYIYSTPPDDGLQICPKHVEVDWRDKARKNSASSWFSLHGYTEMQGHQNVKLCVTVCRNSCPILYT